MLLVAVACVAASAPSNALAAPSARGQKLVKVVGPTAFAPIARANGLAIRVPLVPRRGVAQSKLRAALLSASVGNRGDKSTFDAFNVSLRKRHGTPRTRDLGLVISTDAKRPAPGPGNYRIRVVVIDPNKGTRQRLSFTIAIANATLNQPETIVINRTVNPFFGSDAEEVSIPLRETSGKSAVSGLTLEVHPATSGADQASGTLKMKPQSVISAGRAGSATISASGSFPLGTSKGTAYLDARQIGPPMAVSYEVRSNPAKAWLLALLVLSVLLGWLTRFALKERKSAASLRIQGELLREQIAQAIARHGEGTFRRNMHDANATLAAQLRERRPKQLKEAIATAHSTLDTELKQLKTRADELAARLTKVTKLTSGTWSLPPGVAAVLADARARAVRANTELQNERVDQASELATGLDDSLAQRIAAPAREWREEAQSLVGLLATPSWNAPGATDGKVHVAATAASTSLTADALTATDAKPEDLLAAVHAATNAVAVLLLAERVAAEALVVDMGHKLTDQAPPERLESIKAKGDELGEALEAAADHEPDQLSAVSAKLSGLGGELKAAIIQVAKDHGNDPSTLDGAFAGGDFQSALDAATAEAGVESVEAAAVAPTARPVDGALLAFVSRLVAPSGPDASQSFAVHSVPVERPTPLELARREFERVRLVETLLLAIAVVAIGYLFFVDKWTGTTLNILEVFAWGYGAQITGDWVQTKLKETSPTPTPATPPTTGGGSTGDGTVDGGTITEPTPRGRTDSQPAVPA